MQNIDIPALVKGFGAANMPGTARLVFFLASEKGSQLAQIILIDPPNDIPTLGSINPHLTPLQDLAERLRTIDTVSAEDRAIWDQRWGKSADMSITLVGEKPGFFDQEAA
jgi:hypothetical protein